MKLFLLERDKYGWDEYDLLLIRATDEAAARAIANKEIDDGGTLWDDGDRVSCKIITVEGEAELIIGSFNAG